MIHKLGFCWCGAAHVQRLQGRPAQPRTVGVVSTPDPVVINPRFTEGDTYQNQDGPLLTRDSTGRWRTKWGLWVYSDQHMEDLTFHPVSAERTR